MKVKELIELLASVPQDAEVIYRYCSDYSVLNAQDIKIQRSSDALFQGSFVVHHNMPERFRVYDPREHKEGSPLPKPPDLVILPGN